MTDTPLTKTARREKRVNAGRLVRAAFVAALGAALANLLVYFLVPAIFRLTLAFPLQGPGSAVQPLPASMVIVASTVPVFGAALLLALLVRFTARPARIFSIIAVVTFVLSLGAPLTLAAPLAVRLTLAVMHTVAAVIITGVLLRAAATTSRGR